VSRLPAAWAWSSLPMKSHALLLCGAPHNRHYADHWVMPRTGALLDGEWTRGRGIIRAPQEVRVRPSMQNRLRPWERSFVERSTSRYICSISIPRIVGGRRRNPSRIMPRAATPPRREPSARQHNPVVSITPSHGDPAQLALRFVVGQLESAVVEEAGEWAALAMSVAEGGAQHSALAPDPLVLDGDPCEERVGVPAQVEVAQRPDLRRASCGSRSSRCRPTSAPSCWCRACRRTRTGPATSAPPACAHAPARPVAPRRAACPPARGLRRSAGRGRSRTDSLQRGHDGPQQRGVEPGAHLDLGGAHPQRQWRGLVVHADQAHERGGRQQR
jgi:hypothetical protein